jgi:hypothetical protein
LAGHFFLLIFIFILGAVSLRWLVQNATLRGKSEDGLFFCSASQDCDYKFSGGSAASALQPISNQKPRSKPEIGWSGSSSIVFSCGHRPPGMDSSNFKDETWGGFYLVLSPIRVN